MRESGHWYSAVSFYFSMLTNATAPGGGFISASAEAASRSTHVCTEQEQIEMDVKTLIGISRYLFIII